ncbi:MAG: adenylate/guanylate cyclase domain-containing protein, partial [Spirochaetota bacterium]
LQKNRDESFALIRDRASLDFTHKMSMMLGMDRGGKIQIMASPAAASDTFTDEQTLGMMNENLKSARGDGFISFMLGNRKYFGVYKYNPAWEMFLIRAEEFSEFNEESNRIFKKISMMIILITIACAVVGVFIIDYILRFIRNITNSIMEMIRKDSIGLIDMKGSQADDVTFMGMAFNTLSDTINTMISIFQKFTNRDIVLKAYEEKTVRLEGSRRELTCLFSDIKSFTNMTEVLGTDIINLLNLHYTRVIKIILAHDGIVGSIIGDALLVVYGTLGEKSAKHKSYEAVMTGYEIHEVTAGIRAQMMAVKDRILSEKRSFTPQEERVFKAVLIEVGVGIDGGDVFYGNIGSYERMTNTVIGDTVREWAQQVAHHLT